MKDRRQRSRMEARRIPKTGQIAVREWAGVVWTTWKVIDFPGDNAVDSLPVPPNYRQADRRTGEGDRRERGTR